MKKCSVCDKEYDDNLNFCPICGSKLEEISPRQAAEKENPDSKSISKAEKSDDEETGFLCDENDETEQERLCPVCGGKINNPNSKFCLMCGANLNAHTNSSEKKCPKCGGFVSDPNAKFCEHLKRATPLKNVHIWVCALD